MKTGKITFEINYAQDALPEVFPEPRTKMTRAKKADAKATTKVAAEQEATEEENAPAAMPEVLQEVTALVEIKPLDISALIAAPAAEKAAPEAWKSTTM